jgi:transposase-like protein
MQDIFNFILSYAESNSLHHSTNVISKSYSNTVVIWGQIVRNLMMEFYQRSIKPTTFSGTVELDESLFGSRMKHNRGRPKDRRIWIFGIVERETNHIKLFPLNDRKRETLTSIIVNHVELGSTIYSDGWSAYNGLTELGYKHLVVEHKHAFQTTNRGPQANAVEIVNNNRIEGAWKHANSHSDKLTVGQSEISMVIYARSCSVIG